MKSKLPVLFLIVVALILVLAVNTFSLKNKDIVDWTKNTVPVFSNAQKQWIKEHAALKIAVDEDLSYLIREDSSEGFLVDYGKEVLAPAGFQVSWILCEENKSPAQLVSDGNADLFLTTVVTGEEDDSFSYTFPPFQTHNTVFVEEQKASSHKGVFIAGSLSKSQQKKYTYQNQEIDWEEANSAADAVIAAENSADIGFIAGSQSALGPMLADSHYKSTGQAVSTGDISFGINKNNSTLYSILNDIVYDTDDNTISAIQGKWYGLSHTLAKEDSSSAVRLVFVIIGAIICTFLIYYAATKNLYGELTERMRQLQSSKREMDALFNAVTYLMAEVTPRAEFRNLNRSFQRYLGVKRREMLGKDMIAVFDLDPGQAEELKTLIHRTAKEGIKKKMYLQAHKRIYEVITFPFEDPITNTDAVLFMAMDVTDIQMAEKQMLQNSKMIAVGQLAAGVAHEIRNPLGVIRNYCYLLRSENVDPEIYKTAIDNMEKALEKSTRIINDLLNFSRGSSNEKETVMLRSRILAMTSFQEGRFKKENIRLHVDCDADLKIHVLAESLEMVLVNLISNAADAIEGGGNITVICKQDGENVMIKVSDDGVGIPKDILQDIFNPFFTTKLHKGGSGLGLYIVYNEVQKLAGTVTVDSKENQGTTFTVTIPVGEAVSIS